MTLIVALLATPLSIALDIPEPQGFVTDMAEILTDGQRWQLEEQLAAVERNTSVEIAILTLPSLEDESLEDAANEIFRAWGIGKEGIDNGALILAVMDGQRVRIEVGYGLEGTVTDAAAGIIIRNRIAPLFRGQQYAQGLSLAAQDIALLASGDPATISAYEAQPSAVTRDFKIVLALVGAYIACAVLIRAATKNKVLRRKWTAGAFMVTGAAALVVGVLIAMSVFWITMFFITWLSIMFSGAVGPMMVGPPGGRFGGGGFGGGSGGGFGGFGGGMSGGGGASGGW
jgi:uncharacterized protein